MSRPPSQYPPGPALFLSPPPSQSGAVTGADTSHIGGYEPLHDSSLYSPRFLDNRFLLVTLILGGAGWIICLVSQAIVTHDESNTPVGTLWFALLVQLYLLFCITLPSARRPWSPTSTTLPEPVTSSQIPSSPPTLPPIIINHTPGSTLRAFSIRSGARSRPITPSGVDKEKGAVQANDSGRPASQVTTPPAEGTTRNTGLLSPPLDDHRVSAPAPLQLQASTSGGPPPTVPPHDTPQNYLHDHFQSPTPPDHPPSLQLSVLASVPLALSVIGIDINVYSSQPAQKALAAGWIIGAAVDILWMWYFTSSQGSHPRRVLDAANAHYDVYPRDSKFTQPFPAGNPNRLSKPPPFRSATPVGHSIPKWKFRPSLAGVQDSFVSGLSGKIRGLSRSRPTSSPIPVVTNKEEAFGHPPGSVELSSPRRSLGDRAGATSPNSQVSSTGRSLTHRVSPPPIPADLEAQAQTSSPTPPGERRLSVVPEIPSIGSPSEGSTSAGAPRTRVSSSYDPETQKRRSAGVWNPPQPPPEYSAGAGGDGEGVAGADKRTSTGGVRAMALYNYAGSETDTNELSFTKGERMEVIDSTGKWWDVRKEDGTVGIVPSNYIKVLDE